MSFHKLVIWIGALWVPLAFCSPVIIYGEDQCSEVNVTKDEDPGEDIASYTQFLDLLIEHL